MRLLTSSFFSANCACSARVTERALNAPEVAFTGSSFFFPTCRVSSTRDEREPWASRQWARVRGSEHRAAMERQHAQEQQSVRSPSCLSFASLAHLLLLLVLRKVGGAFWHGASCTLLAWTRKRSAGEALELAAPG